jgi:hypothetical protein
VYTSPPPVVVREILHSKNKNKYLFILSIITAIASLLLGGGTRSGFWGDAILQMLSIPLFLISIGLILRAPDSVPWSELLLWMLIIAIPIAQLIPLPPSLWLHLPGHELRSEVFRLSGQQLRWMPTSFTPEETALAALSLITPSALFLSIRQLDEEQRGVVTLAVLGFAVFSIFLGLAQVAGGPLSPLRFFFAN